MGFMRLPHSDFFSSLLRLGCGLKWNGLDLHRWACLVVALFIMAGCAGSSHRKDADLSGHPLRGVASWYGPSFHGNPTANGEPYDMWALTAAHRTLPFGTLVQVESVQSGKSVTVRINDRGPFVGGRVIDLSYGAARELAMIGKGTDEVILTILENSHTNDSNNFSHENTQHYWVQAASFATLTQAVSLREALTNHYPHVRVMTVDLQSGQWHRVQIGTFPSHEKAKMVARELENRFNLDPLLIQGN